jgi:hypothetical protein
VIPHESRNPVTALKPSLLQSFSQELCPAMEICVGVSMYGMIGKPRDNLLLREEPARTLEYVR